MGCMRWAGRQALPWSRALEGRLAQGPGRMLLILDLGRPGCVHATSETYCRSVSKANEAPAPTPVHGADPCKKMVGSEPRRKIKLSGAKGACEI